MELIGAEVLVAGLKSAGVRVIFGVSASALLRTLDVLRRTPEIRYIQSQHEQGAMYMANGYARQSRQVGICLVSSGPAETNCLSGTAQAYYTSAPSVVIAAEESSRFLGLGAAIHHDLDAPRLFAPITKLAVRVARNDRIQETLQRALSTALAGRPGPTFVGIPADFLNQKIEVESTELRLFHARPPRGNRQDIEAVADLLQAARRPFILAGGGINSSGAHRELIELAELLSAPVAATKGHSGIFPADHPLSLGHGRTPGATPPAERAYQAADVILGIGSSFGYTVDGFSAPLPRGVKVAHIDIDPAEIGKVIPVDAGVAGDAKLVLQELIETLQTREHAERRTDETREWVQELTRLKAEWARVSLPARMSNQVPIQTARLLSDLRKALPRNAQVSGDSGGTAGWFEHEFEGLAPNTVGGWHPMGAEFCEAMGAKVASPDAPVVCVTGDGSTMMSLSEWATAVANNIPVICVVLHNGVFGNMRAQQIRQFDGRFIATDVPTPNLTNIAREFGAHAERVVDPEQIIPAVGRALDSGRPAFLEIMVDPSPDNLVAPRRRRVAEVATVA